MEDNNLRVIAEASKAEYQQNSDVPQVVYLAEFPQNEILMCESQETRHNIDNETPRSSHWATYQALNMEELREIIARPAVHSLYHVDVRLEQNAPNELHTHSIFIFALFVVIHIFILLTGLASWATTRLWTTSRNCHLSEREFLTCEDEQARQLYFIWILLLLAWSISFRLCLSRLIPPDTLQILDRVLYPFSCIVVLSCQISVHICNPAVPWALQVFIFGQILSDNIFPTKSSDVYASRQEMLRPRGLSDLRGNRQSLIPYIAFIGAALLISGSVVSHEVVQIIGSHGLGLSSGRLQSVASRFKVKYIFKSLTYLSLTLCPIFVGLSSFLGGGYVWTIFNFVAGFTSGVNVAMGFCPVTDESGSQEATTTAFSVKKLRFVVALALSLVMPVTAYAVGLPTWQVVLSVTFFPIALCSIEFDERSHSPQDKTVAAREWRNLFLAPNVHVLGWLLGLFLSRSSFSFVMAPDWGVLVLCDSITLTLTAITFGVMLRRMTNGQSVRYLIRALVYAIVWSLVVNPMIIIVST